MFCFVHDIGLFSRERRQKSTVLEEVTIYSFGLKYWHLSGGQVCAGTHHIILEWFKEE
jgi:hypothetical protein